MISVREAIQIVIRETPRLPSKSVPLTGVLGRVLAEDIIADSDLPPFDRSQMDGYAVRSSDTQTVPARLRIAGESAAGSGWPHEMRAREAVRIMTGAPVPAGADSIQQVELTAETDSSAYVEIQRPTAPGQFIVPRGSEVRKDARVLERGETINAAMTAVIAAFGYAHVSVAQRPHVAILATGSELVPVRERPGPDQIRDSNTWSLAAYAELAGGKAERLPLTGDDPALLQSAIEGAAVRSDLVVLSGGVSMGVYDFTKTALRALGAEIFFERVSLRPGKPTVFARLGETLVFGLPGNPVSVSVTFNLFARTALRAMQSAATPAMVPETAVLARAVKGSGERESYLPAILRSDSDGRLVAEPLKWGGSSDFVGFARTTALIIVPAGTRGIEEGSKVEIVRLPG